MISRHWRFLLLEQGVGAGIVNALMNALIAWLTFRGADAIPLWGQQSIGADVLGTTFVLPFLTTLIVSRIVRAQLRRGHLPMLTAPVPTVLTRLPASLAGRGAVLGLACVVLVGVPAVVALIAADVSTMSVRDFVGFKAAFGGVLGAVVTPPIAFRAFADPV